VEEVSTARKLTTWIPKEDTWLFAVFQDIRVAAARRGIPMSQNDVVRQALLKQFAPLKERYVRENNSVDQERGSLDS
jgi:hypothetical protein